MENRFGIKDFFLLLLVIVLIVSVWIAMKQFDRQWEQVRAIRERLDDQSRDLREIQRALNNGVALATPPNVGNNGASASTQPIDLKDDPFARMRQARAMQGFAQGDWLVESFPGGIAKITPLLSGDVYASELQDNVLETLATRDRDTLEWTPLLSKGWEISPDGLTITFTMRENVRFSDGHPLTADDVVFTFNFIMDEKIAAPRQRVYYKTIESVTKKGEKQVVFKYREPYFEAFDLAASIAVMPQHFYGKYKAEEFNQSVGLLMGSGPYRMESPTDWKPGTLIQVVRNERYWGITPAFDRRVFKEITNDTGRLTAFRNGETDLFGATAEQYDRLIKEPELVARTKHFDYLAPSGGYRFIAWNQQTSDGKPTRFADKRVRQALTMLVDRTRLMQEVQLGYAEMATGPFSPLSKQYDTNVKAWPYDPERAKGLLKEAGFKDGNGDGVIEGPDGAAFQFKFTYPSGSANYEKMVLAIKDSFAKAGIALQPDPLEWSVFTDRLNNKNFDAISLGWTAGIETDLHQFFHSSQTVAGGDNFVNYKNPQLDEAIDKARHTVKEQERMPLWHEAHRIIHEDQPYTFLWFGKTMVFIDNRIENIQRVKLGLNGREEWFVPKGKQRWTK